MMAGVMLGSLVYGIWADYQGRRIPFLAGLVSLAIFGTAIAYVSWLWLFLTLRFFNGFSAGGLMTTSFVLLMELSGRKRRVTLACVYHMSADIAYLLLSLLGYLCRDYRISQLVVAVPPFLLLLLCWIVPESPRHLISRGRIDEAIAVMEKIARINKLPIDEIGTDVAAYANYLKQNGAKNGKMLDLFRPKMICFRTFVLTTNWIAIGICFYGVAQYAGRNEGDIFANIAISASMLIPATLVSILLVHKAGRKWSLLVTSAFASIPMFVIPFLSSHLVAIPALISMFGLAASFNIIYVYSGELYPTFIRSMGVGYVSMMCRVGTISAPFIASLGHYVSAEWLPPVVFGLLPLIGGFLIIFMPETNNQLADRLEDALNLGKKSSQHGGEQNGDGSGTKTTKKKNG